MGIFGPSLCGEMLAIKLKKWLPWITGGVVIAALIWAFLYLKALHPFGAMEAKLKQDELSGIGLFFRDANIIGRQDGKKVWSFRAKSIEVSRDRRLVTFQNIINGTLIKDGNVIASLSAKKVIYDSLIGKISAPGLSEVKIVNGPTLKVKNIYWNGQKSKLVCTGGIRANFDGSTLEGERLTADFEKKEITIDKVRGTIRIPD